MRTPSDPSRTSLRERSLEPTVRRDGVDMTVDGAVGGPVTAGWREVTLTRAKEIEALHEWLSANDERPRAADGTLLACDVLSTSVTSHIAAARDAAKAAALDPSRRWHGPRSGALRERALSNLDAADAQLLASSSDEHVLGQMPGLLGQVQSHLVPSDPRRQEMERIARRLGLKDADPPVDGAPKRPTHREQLDVVRDERRKIIAASRAATSAGLRELVRVRDFRNVLLATTAFLWALVLVLAIAGAARQDLVPLCFAPQEAEQVTIVCPTGQSDPIELSGGGSSTADVDQEVAGTTTPWDTSLVLLVGLTAASVAAAAAIGSMRGSSERNPLLLLLTMLKLPTGAITAFLGLLLIRGEFVPGLTALDTPGQILAWALVFGYAQQLFTRLVDQQGQAVLNDVRVPDRAEPQSA